ncbi:hypothetical protein D0C36_07270 [Mucilaginibacter conchicola]|uniref:Carboxypeptidase regulatory-like domain-containing protein n=1 Tax=Mucilaginibacter conchicola TaxID=2303333 RepID=A0A372NZH9_9SPHI|nr:hypothetical protein [Mucilaginibacter conchicola]RFZ95321.1 hypothetical protein D0C36_07270 [Mucilaginibacter conchicola]
MRKIERIDIPEPCSVQWDNMQPMGEGRFCSNCSKTVIDFTMMPNNEIIEYLSRHQRVCGKLYEYQLSRLNQSLLTDRRNSSSWRKIIAAACIAGLVSVVNIKASAVVPTEQLTFHQKKSEEQATDSTTIKLKGRLIDKITCLPIEKAYVSTDKKGHPIKTNKHGEFALKAPRDARYFFVYRAKGKDLTGAYSISADSMFHELIVPLAGIEPQSNDRVRMGEIRTKPGQKFDKTIRIRSAKEIGKLGGFDEVQTKPDSTTTNNLR